VTPTPLPFPHLCLDGHLPAGLLAEAGRVWPARDWPGWIDYDRSHGGPKRASGLITPIPSACGELLRLLALLPVGEWFGIPDLIPDLGLWGAGLHQLDSGARLPLHLDAERHGRLHLGRVLSAVLYVHPEWETSWGGDLELWSETERVAVSIAPLPGRLVLFDARGACHAVAPITGPAPRQSLTMFWYSQAQATDSASRAHFLP
jgi:hypothetical protein